VFHWIDPLVNQIAVHADDIIVIQVGFLCIVISIFVWLWNANRKKYNNLKHAIPADVVKSYLDSIIMNSTSLKSQLFRGGGLEVGGVPSVLPLQHLTGGEGLAISGAPSTALLEELNQKKAQIAALEAQLASLQNSHREIEGKLTHSQTSLSSAELKIRELEALLAQSRESGGGDSVLKSEIAMVSKERDELRDRLKEFEIIADDLANLKRLQQENQQLKRSLAAQGGASVPHVEATPSSAPISSEAAIAEVSDLFDEMSTSHPNASENKLLEDFMGETTASAPGADNVVDIAPAKETVASKPAEEELIASSQKSPAQTPQNDEATKQDKTPEDLLSEFEKMLG
jgi:hypothetical protein